MKNTLKNFLTAAILITVISFAVNAQTNVSGGIYSNTTWTLANSPYIVTAYVVVFPGITLTIEPGVTVKFDDNTNMEIRQATLIAIGNAVDSITFTSNSLTPTPGIWGTAFNGGIWLNGALVATSFNFINMKYATIGIYNGVGIAGIKNSVFINNLSGLHYIYSTRIDSCIFKFNSNGMNNINGCPINFCTISNNTNGIGELTGGSMVNCVVDSNQTGLGGVAGVDQAKIYNCIMNYNQTGMISGPCCSGAITVENCIVDYNITTGIAIYGNGQADTVVNNEIKFNGIGLIASACPSLGVHGMVTKNIIEGNNTGIQVGGCFNIYCNKICNNTTYDLENLGGFPHNVSNNYWCTNDSLTIANSIYDGYDNASLGLVNFMPVDTIQCYSVTGIPISEFPSFSIYPNPASDYLTIQSPANISKAEVKIFNITGELEYSAIVLKGKVNIDISSFIKGVYIIQISDGEIIYRQKLIRQ